MNFRDDPLARVGWYDENSEDLLHPVGSKPANAFGLFDMHGNVWEWCEDRWHPNYDQAPADGSAWTNGPYNYRVRRGGSYSCHFVSTRSGHRTRTISNNDDDSYGGARFQLPGAETRPAETRPAERDRHVDINLGDTGFDNFGFYDIGFRPAMSVVP
jgi:hypothetical protein